MAQRTWLRRFTYNLTCVLVRTLAIPLFGMRTYGLTNVPQEGGGLVCANHQSYFDPLLIGVCFPRRLNFLARDTLFRGPFGWLIAWYDAIPLQREGLGIGGLKESMRRLKQQELLLIFPEGTRSRDGEMSEVQGGFVALARKTKVPIIPVGIDGAYQAWPRGRAWPRIAPVQYVVGKPVSSEIIDSLTDEELKAEVESRIRACWGEARARIRQGVDGKKQ